MTFSDLLTQISRSQLFNVKQLENGTT